MDYYNDNSEDAQATLASLARDGEIPDGYVDGRSIRDVQSRDLAGFDNCHFFAGIGGWSLALQLAGWNYNLPVWTGSCPCQPFSVAGRRKGEADERHLWPEFARLIGERRPPVLFGEQVASRDGREWLARVRLDLEEMGYAVGAADLCAAGIGAPHIRQRLYFGAVRLGNADGDGRETGRGAVPALGYGHSVDTTSRERPSGLANAHSFGEREPQHALGSEPRGNEGADTGRAGGRSGSGLANTHHQRLARPAGIRRDAIPQLAPVERNGAWGDAEWLDCNDEKSRRVKPGVRLLVNGVPRDVAPALSGLGNAIVPPLAAKFIRSFSEAAGIDCCS